MDAKTEAFLRECVWLMGFKAKDAKIDILFKKKERYTSKIYFHLCIYASK